MTDNFNFELVGQENAPFRGYISSVDKTNVSPEILVRGSKNVYKKISGTIANRPGQLKFGAADPTVAGVISSYEWDSSIGIQRPMRVVNGKLQVESTTVDGVTPVWYTLVSGYNTGYAPGQSRFVFSPWWNNLQKRDILIMVHGTADLLYWGGGVTQIGTPVATAISGVGNNALLTINGATVFSVPADGYTYSNQLVGTSAFIGIALLQNPGNGDIFQFNNLNGNGVLIHFVSVIGATAGNVLIGANTAATLANLLGLLQNPATTSATQVALSAPAQTVLGYITFTSGYAIPKLSSATTWSQDGFYVDTFAVTKTVIINGTTYTYLGGEGSQYLFGVSPSAAVEISGEIALQGIQTKANLPDATGGFSNDFIKTIGNQLYVGSYTSRLVYISQAADFTNYSIPTPRTPGAPELLTLDNAGRGISVSKGDAYISAGSKDWYIVSFENITVGSTLTQKTNVDKRQTADLNAALAHEFIDTVGDDIVFLAQDQQVRYFGSFRNLTTPKFPSLSTEVEDELSGEVFTGGHLRAAEDFIYVTAPNAGRVYLRQTRTKVDDIGNVTAERLWHSPFIWNVSRIAIINSTVYGHSNANPMIYQLWDTGQWHDDSPSGDSLPYTSVAKFAYRNNPKQRSNLIWFDKTYFEGYLSLGTEVNGHVYFDYQGNNGIQNIVLNSVDSPAKLFSYANSPSLGDSPLGDSSLGDGLVETVNGQDELPKFRTVCDINPIAAFEVELEVYSDTLDARWELLCLGPNITAPPNGELPTFLRK